MKKKGHLPWLMLSLIYILLILTDRSNASNHDLKEELRVIHREIGLLRDENHHQNMEIALLKGRVGITKNSDDQGMVTASLDDKNRNKRPVRLLPPHILYGNRKNETQEQEQITRRRYEQPTNCSDLSILGYTLNGFYVVKSNESANTTNNDIKLETVFCAFKQPEGVFNLSLVEKRIISRRETKPSNGRVLYFHATRKTDLEAIGGTMFTITFDKVNVNLGNAFDGTIGTFDVQKSGVYLFIFRGMVTFPLENSTRQFYYTKNGINIGKDTIMNQNKSMNVELDNLVKGNRGDIIMVSVFFYEIGAKFSGNSTSFAAYMLED